MYLVASGGTYGSNTSANGGIKLMTALGSCSKLPSSVTINEVTTVASAYALSAFAIVNTSGGIEVGAPALASDTSCNAQDNWQSSGPNTCNYTGLVHAFGTANNLVGPATGVARSYTPAYTQNLATDTNILNNSTVPTTGINVLADMLASCVESDGSGCARGLIKGATTGAATSTTIPIVTSIDTLQAALNIAQNPGNNVSTLLGLVSSMASQPYSTGTLLTQTTPPTDLTLALTYTGAGLGGAPNITFSDGNNGIYNSSLSIDALGNIWVAVYRTGGLFGSFNN